MTVEKYFCSERLQRSVATLLVATVGFVSMGVFVADAFDSARPLVGRLLSAYSVLFSTILVVGAGWLLWGERGTDRPVRVAGWCLAGVVLLFVIERGVVIEHAMSRNVTPAVAPVRVALQLPVLGGIVGLLLGFYDADRLQRYEAERRLRGRLESVLSASLVPIIVLDEAMQIQRWNDAAERLFGWTKAEVVGERPPMPPPGEQAVLDDIDERLDTDGPIVGSTATRSTKSGEQLEIRRSVARVRDDGEDVGYVVVAEDVTDERRQRRNLERSRDLLARTQRLATVGGWELDLRTDELHITDGTRAIYEVGPEFEPSFETAMEFVNPDSRESLRRAIDRCRRTGTPYELELQLTTRTGRERWVRARGERVTGDDGRTILRGTLQDVTEQKQREQQLAVLNRLFRHDLRNSLNVVTGRTELLLDALEPQPETERQPAMRPTDAVVPVQAGATPLADTSDDDPPQARSCGSLPATEAREHLDSIRRQAEALVSIGDKVCKFEELSTSGTHREMAVDVRPLFERLRSEHALAHSAAHVEIDCADSVAVRGDPELLDMAVGELLENALEHADADAPVVELSASTHAHGRVLLCVRDDGPGLSAYERDVVTGDDETPLIHGSGVGLWLVDWVVTRLGGTMRFADNEPRGTVVTLELPAADPS
jgi:PAS domain S-box-containing protein